MGAGFCRLVSGVTGARDPQPPPSDKRDALDDLAARIAETRGRQQPVEKNRGHASMLGLAYRFTVEMLAGIGVGGFVGWWMDKWFGTSPAFLLILLFLGMIAGLVNSVRTVNEMRRSLDHNAAGTAREPDQEE